MNYSLEDAQVMALLHPTTFQAPTLKELREIEVGDYVKVCFKVGMWGERMWVQVTKIDGEALIGSLNNDPVLATYLRDGDEIKFEKRHIYSAGEPPI